MRCELVFDDSKNLSEQKVSAYSVSQSTNDDPAYKETDIKNSNDRSYFFGYKCAIDDVCDILDGYATKSEDVSFKTISLLFSGAISEESNEFIQDNMASKVCEQLYSILDNEVSNE